MNRRDFTKGWLVGLLGSSAGIALADCRDDNGMINPDWEDLECHDLVLNQAIVHTEKSGIGYHPMTGRALFGFGNYETLMARQRDRFSHTFTFRGEEYRMKVTRLSIDVNRHLGCVVCEVHGRVFT